jgi:hypothetical protein
MFKCSKQPNTEAFVLNIEKFDLPAVQDFGRRVFGFLPEREFPFRH